MGPPIGQVKLLRVIGGYACGPDREDAPVLALPGMFRDAVRTALGQFGYFLGHCSHGSSSMFYFSVKLVVFADDLFPCSVAGQTTIDSHGPLR